MAAKSRKKHKDQISGLIISVSCETEMRFNFSDTFNQSSQKRFAPAGWLDRI
jgi:hypothetical protein